MRRGGVAPQQLALTLQIARGLLAAGPRLRERRLGRLEGRTRRLHLDVKVLRFDSADELSRLHVVSLRHRDTRQPASDFVRELNVDRFDRSRCDDVSPRIALGARHPPPHEERCDREHEQEHDYPRGDRNAGPLAIRHRQFPFFTAAPIA